MLGGHLFAMTQKPQTYNGDLTELPPALMHLRDEKVWVCWRWLQNGKKWTKPPYRADDPEQHASTSNPVLGVHTSKQLNKCASVKPMVSVSPLKDAISAALISITVVTR